MKKIIWNMIFQQFYKALNKKKDCMNNKWFAVWLKMNIHFISNSHYYYYCTSWVEWVEEQPREKATAVVFLLWCCRKTKKRESTWNNNKRRKHGMKNELHLTHPMNVKGMKKRRKKDCSATISTRVFFFFFNITPSFWYYASSFINCVYILCLLSPTRIYIFYQLPISLSFKRRQVESVQFIF